MAFCEGRSSLHLARFSSKGKSASAGRSPPEALPDHTLPAKEPAFLSTSFLTHIFTVTQSLRFSPQVPKGIDYISSHLYFAEVFPPSICHEVMGVDAMILVFLMLSFKPTFPLSSLTFINILFSSFSLVPKGWCHLFI